MGPSQQSTRSKKKWGSVSTSQNLVRLAGLLTVPILTHFSYSAVLLVHNGVDVDRSERMVLASALKHWSLAGNELLFPSGKPKTTVAYATSFTGCKPEKKEELMESAAVLAHSISLVSNKSAYDYRMYAFVHSNATLCREPLQRLGYSVLVRETPVDVDSIKNNTKYVEAVKRGGCCGEKEFLKLYSLTLTDYPIVVHLDIDTIILKPLDVIYDVMMQPADATKHVEGAMWEPKTVTHPINSFFTRDYPMSRNMKNPPMRVGMQGGFWVLRPNMTVFQEYCDIILSGSYIPGLGWGGKEHHHGHYYGGAQIQGLVSYYHGPVHPNTSIELDHCIFNNMGESPTPEKEKECLAQNISCQDCRQTEISKIYTAHFTLCQKPRLCPLNTGDLQKRHLCLSMHREWHRIRHELEVTWGTAENNNNNNKTFSIKPSAELTFNRSEDLTPYFYGGCEKAPGGGYKFHPLRMPQAISS